MSLIFVCVALIQADEIQELVQKLKSDRIEERASASMRLALLGEAAVPTLRNLEKDPDLETALRAREILAGIERLKLITPALDRIIPRARERVALGGDLALTELFLEAVEREGTHRHYPSLARQDIEPLAVPALRAARPEDEKAVREAIVASGSHTAWPELIRRARRFDGGTCYLWIEAVGKLGAREAVPELLALLKEPRAGFWKRSLISALEDLEAREAVPAYLDIIRAGAPFMNERPEFETALKALARIDGAEALRVLVPLASQPSTSHLAMPLLRELSLPAALEVALQYLRSARFDDQILGRNFLAKIQAREAIPHLLPLLDHKDARERSQAIRALDQLSARESIPKLKERLGDPDGEVRLHAASALAFLGVRDAIPELHRNIRIQQSPYLHPACSLAKLGAREAIPDLLKMTEPSDPLRGTAALALGKLGAAEAADRIRPLLCDPEPYVRTLAATGLTDLLGPAAAADLRPLLQDLNDGVQHCAARLLTQPPVLGRKEDLLAALDGPRFLRTCALSRIVEIDCREALPRLVKELETSNEDLPLAKTVGLLGAPEAGPPLRAFLMDPTDCRREDASKILCTLGDREAVPILLAKPFDYWSGFALNALRRPDLWKAWGERKLDGTFEGPTHEAVALVARQAGISVEWPATGDEDWMFGHRKLYFAGRSLRGVLWDIFYYSGGGIIEPDRLRLLSQHDSRRFWKRWWAEERLESGTPAEQAAARREIEELASDERRLAEARASFVRKAPSFDKWIPPAFLLVPGLEERLKRGGDEACAQVLLEMMDYEKRKPYEGLTPQDLDVLAVPALRGTRIVHDLSRICGIISQKNLASAAPELPKLFSHPSGEVRIAAAWCLAHLKGQEAFPEILPLLKDSNKNVQGVVVEILGAKGTKEHLPIIMGMRKELGLSRHIASAIWRLKAAEGIPYLVEMTEIEGDDYMTRNAGAMYLNSMAGPEMIPHMRKLALKHAARDPNTANDALRFLAKWGAREASGDIASLFDLEERNAQMVYDEASRAVEVLNIREALPKMVRKLEAGAVNFDMIRILGTMRVREAIPAIRRMLEGEQGITVAIHALGQLGDRESIPKLRDFLNGKDTSRREAAAEALGLLGDRESLPLILDRSGKKEGIGYGTLKALALLGAENLKTEVLRRFQGAPYGTEDLVAEICGEDLLPLLKPALRSEHQGGRYGALRLLGRIEGQASVALSRSMLRDPDDSCRSMAAANLCRRGERDGREVLIEAGRLPVVLNAIRRPDTWKRLEERPLRVPLYASLGELYYRIALEAGLSVEGPPPEAAIHHPWTGRHVRLSKLGRPPSLAWALEFLEDPRWGIVIEDDRLRVLPREEALRFWKGWRESGGK